MAKKYIYRESKVFRATFISEGRAIDVVRNPLPEGSPVEYIKVEQCLKDWDIDLDDFNKIAKTISIIPVLSPTNGKYWLDENQYTDMRTVVRSFLTSENSLSRDISKAIREHRFVEIDKLPEENEEKQLENTKQNETEEYNNNRKKFVDKVRRKNKKEIGKKFVVGKKYFLKVRSVTNFNHIYKIYELKKFIYSINNRTVNVVIMKRINGEDDERFNTTFTLNSTDCAKYHVKYEPGLQVFPMELNWCLVNENNVKFKEALNYGK